MNEPEFYSGDPIQDGIAAADRATARLLAKSTKAARRVWASIATYQLPTVLEESLIRKLTRSSLAKPLTEEEVRAALVELHTRGLLSFIEEGESVSHCGAWGVAVNDVLKGAPGSAKWGLWVDRDEVDRTFR